MSCIRFEHSTGDPPQRVRTAPRVSSRGKVVRPRAVPDPRGSGSPPTLAVTSVNMSRMGGSMTPDDRTSHQHTPEEERTIRDAALDKTIEDSFPASDPPSSDPNPCDDSAAEREGRRDDEG